MSAKELRTPREKTLFVIAALFSAVVWLLLLVTVVGLVYGALIGLFALFAHCLVMAYLTGNGVRVGPQQLPGLWRRIEEASRKLGLDRAPEAYVVQAGGILNAFATKILSRRFIVLYSDLVEACEDGTGTEANELDFVIGHELGHVAAGHLKFRLFLLPAWILPLIGAAYSRACEYTCDRCGHEVVGDLTISSRALAILAAGPHTARRMNLDAFVEQRSDHGRFWMAVYELNASHPFLPKRVAALREWRQHGSAAPRGRNVLAYPLAPLFGMMSGNPASGLGLVLIIVVLSGAFYARKFGDMFRGLAGGAATLRSQPGASGSNGLDPNEEATLERVRQQLEQAKGKE